jgi:hypothetical protein
VSDEIADRWLAATIDAGGSIAVARRRTAQGGHTYWGRIAVSSGSRALLDRVQEVAGVGLVRDIGRSAGYTAPYWRWTVDARQALRVLPRIRPYLIAQVVQADAALAVQAINAGTDQWHGTTSGDLTALEEHYARARAAAGASAKSRRPRQPAPDA